jgi:hypothetical protein
MAQAKADRFGFATSREHSSPFQPVTLGRSQKRTGIGSHPSAHKSQQFQAPLTGYVRRSEIFGSFGQFVGVYQSA